MLVVRKNFISLKVVINLGVYYSFQDFPWKAYLGDWSPILSFFYYLSLFWVLV